jgi:hypothetical protein
MEIHRKYLNGDIDRDQYWSEMCKINIEQCDQLTKIVNDAMIAMTGNSYLKMSHDTEGFPSYWASKKKYAYLKVEDILATLQDKEHKQSIDYVTKYLKVDKGFF